MVIRTNYDKQLIKGRFTYTQVISSNVAGEVPTIDDLAPGGLAINIPDAALYTSNGSAVFTIASIADISLLVSNTYLQANYGNVAYNDTRYIANVASGTGAVATPVGNSTNRPTAANGYIRYNTEVDSLEAYIAGAWRNMDYAGGANTQVQFNDSHYFGGNAGFTYDKTTNNVYIANTANVGILVAGDGTTNLVANSTIVKLASAAGSANLDAGKLLIGIVTHNSTALGIGANVLLTSTLLSVGNSTANILANSILVSLANSTGIANLQPTALTIGTSIVNAASISAGGSGGLVINTTAFAAGANVLIDMTKIFIGNTTVNTVANSIAAVFSAVATTVTVNSSQITVGANAFLSTTTVSVGNSTANLLANSILVKVANSTGIANLEPGKLTIGSTIVNTTAVAANTLVLQSGSVTHINAVSNSTVLGAAVNTEITTTWAIKNYIDTRAVSSTVDIVVIIGDNSTTITTGVKGYLPVDFGFTIVQWTLVADASGSIVVDIWKDTYANYPPTVADTITASAKPTITTATKGQSSTLTGWTTTVAAGDVLGFNVDSITTCKQVTLILKVTRTV